MAKKTSFKIDHNLGDNNPIVEGYVVREFGIHQTYPGVWRVSHIPTGFSFGSLADHDTKREAVAFAERLLALPINWLPDTETGLIEGNSHSGKELRSMIVGAAQC